MQHVRVGEHDVGLAAQVGALLARRVAVVDRRPRMRLTPNACSERAWSCASAFDGYRNSARARASRERISSVGSWKHSDLPDAVPVVTIVVALPRRLERLRLVAPEEVDPAPRAAPPRTSGCSSAGSSTMLREARVLHRLAHEPLVRAPALQQLVPGLDARGRWPHIRSYEPRLLPIEEEPPSSEGAVRCSLASSPWRPRPSTLALALVPGAANATDVCNEAENSYQRRLHRQRRPGRPEPARPSCAARRCASATATARAS